MQQYLHARRLAQVVVVVLWLEAAASVLSIGSGLLQMNLISRMQSGAGATEAEIEFNDLREFSIGILEVGLAILGGVLFLKFLGRTNHNATALGARGLSATPGWTIGYFFVPILNLFKPYQVLQEIWKASDPDAGDRSDPPGSPLIGWWWGIRLIDLFANQALLRLSLAEPQETSLEGLAMSTQLDLGVSCLDLILMAVSVFLVQALQRRQEARHERQQEASAFTCPACGERLDESTDAEGRCPVCGAKVQRGVQPAGTESSADFAE